MNLLKPTTNQKWLLGLGLGGAAAVLVYFKFFNTTTATTTAAPAATTQQASFTGGYDPYCTYLSADGNNEKRCQDLNDALMLVRTALSEENRKNLRPAQITGFKAQEMQILRQLQTLGCK